MHSDALNWDERVVRVVRARSGSPTLATAGKSLSWVGEHGALWLTAGLVGVAVDDGRRGTWLRATALVAGAHLASMGVKRVVARPRPQLDGLEPLVRTAGQHSFPSSHASSSVAAVVAFAGLLPVAPVAGVAAAVCASRLAVGVHYPSDVLGGAVLGGALAALGRRWAHGGPTGGASGGAGTPVPSRAA